MSPIAGILVHRAKQWGKQTVIGTPVAATARVPFSGVPTINPGWTDPEGVYTGNIDRVQAPYRTAIDVTSPFEGQLTYNDLPRIMGAIKGGVSAVGAGADKTWTHQLASATQDSFDYITEEFFDDDTADVMQLYGGVVEEVTFELPADMGPWTVSGTLRFANANGPGTVGSVPTTGLTVPTNPIYVYGGHTAIYINDTAGAIGTTQLTDALHSATITIAPEIDQKRFANGTGFGLVGYARGGRDITAEFRFAKTAAVRAEVAKWISTTAQNRYIEVRATSDVIITAAIPYSWSQRFGGRWYTREDGEEGSDSTIVLGCTAFVDTTLTYPYRSVVVNTQAA